MVQKSADVEICCHCCFGMVTYKLYKPRQPQLQHLVLPMVALHLDIGLQHSSLLVRIIKAWVSSRNGGVKCMGRCIVED